MSAGLPGFGDPSKAGGTTPEPSIDPWRRAEDLNGLRRTRELSRMSRAILSLGKASCG